MAKLFELGRVVTTTGAGDLLYANGVGPYEFLERHQAGDWGDLEQEDRQANDDAVKSGLRILSAYKVGQGTVWVITEADRSATTFLLPSEY